MTKYDCIICVFNDVYVYFEWIKKKAYLFKFYVYPYIRRRRRRFKCIKVDR